MSTHRRTWQKREQKAAELFGARRQTNSGSSNRDDQTSSDSTHPRLYIETKLRQKHAARELLEFIRAKARRERKTPVLILASKGKPDMIICCFASDLQLIAQEMFGEDVADAIRAIDLAESASFALCEAEDAAIAGDIDKSVHLFSIADELVRLSLAVADAAAS